MKVKALFMTNLILAAREHPIKVRSISGVYRLQRIEYKQEYLDNYQRFRKSRNGFEKHRIEM